MKVRKEMKVKLHAFLNVARLEIIRFSLYFGIWETARRAYEGCCILGLDMIYLLSAIGLPPGGSSTVHIYTQTVHITKQNKQYIEQHNNLGECGPCPVLARFSLAFTLQLRKKHGKTSVRVAASKIQR